MKKKIYISGKMTGVEDFNRPKFKEAEDRLRAAGYEPVNPHNIKPAKEHSQCEWTDFMRADIKELMDCDMVAVLDDWQESKGAKLEVMVAAYLELPFLCAHELTEVQPYYDAAIYNPQGHLKNFGILLI